MQRDSTIALIRCLLDGSGSTPQTRYVRAGEFELWRHLMLTKHARSVSVDEASIWVPDAPGLLDDERGAEALEPVLRVRFDKSCPGKAVVPVERFFGAETYPQARAALLAHFDPRCRRGVEATPGYFIASPQSPDATSELDVVEDVA